MKKKFKSPNQNSDYDTEEDVSTYDKEKCCLVVFDQVLENKQKDNFIYFTSGRHEHFAVCFYSQRHFELSIIRRDSRKNNILIIQFDKTVENLLIATAKFDTSYEVFNQFCSEALRGKYTYPKFKRLVDEEKFCVRNAGEKD